MSAPRTYGGWRRSRRIGLLGLGPLRTLLVLGALVLVVLSASISPKLSAMLAVPAVLLVAGVAVRIDDLSLVDLLLARVRWQHATLRGHTSYRSGVLVAGEHAWTLPGLLAPTRLLSVPYRGGELGIVHHPRLSTFTVTLRVAATTTWLTEPGEGDTWVASWGAWLAALGHHRTLQHVAITVDTAPDPGSRLADHIAARILPGAPAPAVAILRQLVDVAPAAAAAQTTTLVSLTFHHPAGPDGATDAAVAQVVRTLPGLSDTLGGCGVTVLGALSAADLLGVVRVAYDPAARGDIERLTRLAGGGELGQYLDWGSAGPVMAEEHWDRYVHDSGVSVSWAWHEAPRQHVYADVLARLLAPGPHPKRVTLLYQPLPAADAARVVEAEVNAAAFRATLHAKQHRDESARDATDRARAQAAAIEEATGAGVGHLTIFVTLTVTDPTHLADAVTEVENRAGTARIRLRRLSASQAAGFAITLPCGLFPPALTRAWPH